MYKRQDSEQLLASNDELMNNKKHKISPIIKINNKQKIHSESSTVILKSNQIENIVSKHISKIGNTKKSNSLRDKKSDDSGQIKRLSRTSILLNLAALGTFTFYIDGYLHPIHLILTVILFVSASIFNLLTISKIKKRKEKIKNQSPNIKRNIWISTFLSIVEFLAAFGLLIWALTFSVGGYGGPW